MEKQYIAPSLTVVAIHVERGYADSVGTIASNGATDGTDYGFLRSLSSSYGCTGSTESRGGSNTSSNWTTSDEEGFWGSSAF